MNFFQIFKLTIPVLMGYIPLGIAFGLLASNFLIPWYYVFFMSIFIFAGAGQFLAITLFASQASIVEIGIAIFLLNLRHFFYGISIMGDLKGMGFGKQYIIFGLTDETFALLKTTPITNKEREKIYTIITALNQSYWVIGSLVGAILGNVIPFDFKGIEFSLTALFVVLAIELYLKNPSSKPLLISLFIGLGGMVILPSDKMLIISLALAAGLLVGLKGWIEDE